MHTDQGKDPYTSHPMDHPLLMGKNLIWLHVACKIYSLLNEQYYMVYLTCYDNWHAQTVRVFSMLVCRYPSKLDCQNLRTA